MDNDTDLYLDRFDDLMRTYFGLAVIGAFVIWLTVAGVAHVVAPRDRPWHFFWCTLFFLGPLGIVLALVAPSRPSPAYEQ